MRSFNHVTFDQPIDEFEVTFRWWGASDNLRTAYHLRQMKGPMVRAGQLDSQPYHRFGAPGAVQRHKQASILLPGQIGSRRLVRPHDHERGRCAEHDLLDNTANIP